MEKSAADEKILSYNDVVLRRSDLDILNGPYFLNDRLIEFYFSHLSSAHPSQEILLVTPAIAFWIASCPDNESLKDFLEPFKLRDKKLVIFPVNDNDDVSLAEGGNHWSLLAYERNSNVFVHHDSSGCINKWHAMQLYKTLVGFVCDSNVAGHARYIEYADSPRQVNGYDCGVYVLAATRVICCWYESSESKDSNGLWLTSLKEQVNPLAAAEMRTEILGLIRELMAGKCTSSSSKGS